MTGGDAMTDNGAAALEKLLHRLHVDEPQGFPFDCQELTDRILATGAVFLPDGREVERPDVLVLRQVRAVIDTLPYTMGHGAVSLVGVLDTIDEAIRRVIEGGSE
jgi:hypothetical protein